MYAAIILVCLASEPTCDIDHAIVAARSRPIFASERACFDGAMEHFESVLAPDLEHGASYQVEIECTVAGTPA